MTIRTKISLFVVPLVLVPLCIVGLFSFQLLNRGFQEQSKLTDQQLSLTVATRIEQLLDECNTNIILLSSILSTRLHLSEEESIEGLIHRVETHIEEITGTLSLRFSPFLRIRIIAPDGRELFVSGSDGREFNLGNALDEPIFLETISVSGQFPPLKDENNGTWTSTFSKSIVYDQTLLGLVYFDLDMKSIEKILHDMTASRPGYYFLFDGSGATLAEAGAVPLVDFSPANENIHTSLRYMTENPLPMFTHYVESAGKHKIFLSSQPVKEYISFRDPLPQERWYLGIVHTDTPILSAFRQSTMIFWVVSGIGLLIAISGTLYISNAITTPIRRLTTAARDFARGRLDSQVDVTSSDEIGHLSVDFNRMSSDIQKLIKERQANETLIAIGRFSAALAHDLRNPVEGMKLLASELKKRVRTGAPEWEIADAIAQSVDNLSSFINQSLDFTRLSEPRIVSADIASLADDVLKDFRFDDIELLKEYSHELPAVEVDTVQIKRVIGNLIANAIEACRQKTPPAGCRIIVRIIHRNGAIHIEVADNGAGISPDVQKMMFEPFFSTKPGGHGLGLALARQIITRHGGTISVESELEKGTRFRIDLPVKAG